MELQTLLDDFDTMSLEEVRSKLRSIKKGEEEKKSFKNNQLPPLATRGNATSSSSSKSQTHTKVKLEEKNFGIIENIAYIPVEQSRIWYEWKKDYQGTQLTFGSEIDVQGFVRLVLKEVIESMNLHIDLDLYNDLFVGSNKSDIWVVKKRGSPIGVIEVKKPSDNIMESVELHGQTYDYLKMIQSFDGVDDPFCIVTTYREWRVCWLPKSDNMAQSKSFETLPQVVSNDQNIVHGTKVYKFDSKDLFNILASTIMKMTKSINHIVKDADPNRTYILYQKENFVWKRFPFGKKFKINWNKLPHSNSNSYAVFKYSKTGRDGKVRIAMNPKSGDVVVIKFSNEKDGNLKKEILEKECALWNLIWNANCWTQTLNNEPALMMPYVTLKDDNHKPTEKQKKEVLTAITKMAKMGYKHNDLHWRHVGLLNDSYVLIDLCDVKEIDSKNKNSLNAAIEEMKSQLGLV